MKRDKLHADWQRLIAERDRYGRMPPSPAKFRGAMGMIGNAWGLVIGHWSELTRLIETRPADNDGHPEKFNERR